MNQQPVESARTRPWTAAFLLLFLAACQAPPTPVPTVGLPTASSRITAEPGGTAGGEPNGSGGQPTPSEPQETSEPQPTAPVGFAPGTVILEQAVNIDAVTGQSVELPFDAGAEQVIRVDTTLYGGNVDYEMIVVDKFGNYLATLRARPGRQSQSIAEFMLPFEGPYRVVLSPVDGAGTVQIRITALGPPSGGGQLEGEPPLTSSTAIGEEAVFHTYQFALREGDTVTVSAEADVNGAPDVRLALYGPDGRFIAEADDNSPPADLNASLPHFIAPLTGTYTAIVSNYGPTTGDYDFSVTSDTEVPATEGTADIVYDSPYRAAFVNQDVLSVTFDGTIGDLLRVSVTDPTPQLDVDIYLFSPFNQIIAFAVDNQAGQGEALNEVQLPYTGRYRLELRPIGDGEASFSLVRLPVEQLTGGGLIGDQMSQTLSGAFAAPNVFHYYQFNATAGDKITLRMTSTGTGIDIGFAVIGPSGEQLVFADDGQGSNPRDPELLRYEVRQTGTFTVIVYTFNGQNGAYDLEYLRE